MSYNDPYGLCALGIGPDAAYGRCDRSEGEGADQSTPLSGPQRRFIRTAVQENVTGVARSRLMDMLTDDRIRHVQRTFYGEPAEAVYDRVGGGGVNVQPNFFEFSNADASWSLVHEDGHLIQWQRGMLIGEIGTGQRSSRRRMRAIFSQPKGSVVHDVMQRDANIYACAFTIDWGRWAGYCY